MGMPTPAMYKDGSGIHINPANKGKFTASASRAGMGVQEFARHVLANKEDYSSTQVKRANFARNAAKWKHEYGGPVDYIPSYAFGNVQSKNTTYNHGFGYGGMIPMYDFGSTIKDIGAGAYGALEGTLDTVTMGATDQLTDAGYKALQKAGGSSAAEIKQQDSIRGYGQAAGAIAGAVVNPAALGTAISEGSEGLGQGISKGSSDSKTAQDVGKYLTMGGRFAGMAVGAGAAGGAPSTVGGGNNIATASGSMPMFTAMGGTVGKPNMMKYNDGGFLNKAGTAGMMGLAPALIAGKMADGGLLGTMIPLARPFMAMGGQVNYPQGLRKNMGNMPIFAEGGMTGNLTQINVEKGELLTDKNGKIVTEYRGGGMVPHPEEGMDERGTVPAQEGMFVITKAKAESYKNAMKNNDKVYADSIRNNIAFDKARKEAKEEAAANAAYNKFAKKYGGAIQRMYAKGGMIPMYYDGAGVTGGLNINNPAFNNNYSFDVPTTTFSGSMEFPNVPSSLNLDSSPMTMAEYRGQTGSYMNPANIPNTGVGYKGSNTSTPPPNQFDYKDFMSKAIPYGVAASQVLEPLLQRPYRMDASKYETPTDLKWRELTGERGRRDMQGAYNLAKYNARQIGGSGILPALTSTAGRYSDSLAAYNEALENKNRLGQSEIDRANKAIQQANFAQRMQIDQFNEQNRAARRNAIRQGVMNLAGTYYNQDASQMTKQGLSAAYPDYVFPWNAKTKKTKS